MGILSSQNKAKFGGQIFSRPKSSISLSEVWQRIRSGDSESELLVKNLNYWSLRQPYSKESEVVGAIDWARLKKRQTLLIRGWVFALDGSTNILNLNIDGSPSGWHEVLAEGLSRNDVIGNFPFVPHAADCGFVIAIPTTYFEIGCELTVKFRMRLESGEVKRGSFMPVQVTSALSE